MQQVYSALEVVEVATGEVERIGLDDRNAAVSVTFAAERIGMQEADVWDVLRNGGDLSTVGFIRRLV